MPDFVQCPSCLLFLRCESEYDPVRQVLTVTVPPHRDECNPAMQRFFNPDAQHFRPFGR